MVEKATRRDAMVGATTGLLAASAGPVRSAQAQQKIAAPNPGQTNPSALTTFAQVTKPANGVIMPEGYVRAMAQFAVSVGLADRQHVQSPPHDQPGAQPGLLDGIVPVAPRGRIAMLADYVPRPRPS